MATESDEACAHMVGVNKVFCCAIGDHERVEFVCHRVLVI